MALDALERYDLGPAIASGGMGTVHVGRIRGAEGFSRVVAIKCLRAELAGDAEHVTMFIDEARMASRIRHANVVPTLDVCRSGGDLWIVMEYVAGESLARLMEAGPIEPAIAIAIFHDALSGLDGAHGATDASGAPLGLVHRDVSPQNVLVGVDGVARIVDFGIAKAQNRASVTRSGEYKGKFGYAPPEVVQGKKATVRSDVYSAGVTLWEALVGKRLFVGDNDATVLYDMLEWIPTPVSVAAPHVGAAFDAVVARALEKDPDKRFASAREMLDALEACAKRAGARDVARALSGAAGDSLAERAELVRAFEEGRESVAPPTMRDPAPAGQVTAVMGETPSGTVRMAPPRAAPPRRAPWIVPVAVAGALVALLSISGAVIRMRMHGSPAPQMTEKAADEAKPAAPKAPIEPAPAPSSASVAEPAPTPASSASAAPRPRSGPKPPRPAASTKSCQPPFTVDAFGDKHYKPECFQ
ncbi:MAG: protein kinase [Labilithrix sp.]|nr:protein kinase [Labilithrix sp.]